MKLLLACATRLLGQRVVGSVDDGEADHAVLDALKSLIHVILPQSQPLHYTAILQEHIHLHFSQCFFTDLLWPVPLKILYWQGYNTKVKEQLPNSLHKLLAVIAFVFLCT